MITFAQLYEQLVRETHSAGIPENHVVPYKKFLIEGLIQIQRNVDCFQVNNTQFYPFCSTMWSCKLTAVHTPEGYNQIKRLYTIRTTDKCAKIPYVQTTYDELVCKAASLVSDSPVSRAPILPLTFKYPDPALDRARRATGGFWALERGKIFVYPFIHSSETLVIEWDGIKRKWIDDDTLSDNQDFLRTIRLFAGKEYARDYEKDIPSYQAGTIEFQDALRDLILDCREETRVRETKSCPPDPCTPCGDPTGLTDVDEFGQPGETTLFANIGDFGQPANGTAEQDVANLVLGWSPDYIITNGDNHYGGPANYAAKVGAFYGDYITADLTTNRFWPALGNHDYNDAGLAAYLAYFTLPGNERYYELVRGPIHFFILNSEPQEPDGISSTSIQAEWLHAKAATSNAQWKVVITQNAPYTSQGTDNPGNLTGRWPYVDWGIDVVISGDSHYYERFEVDGLPYIINGAGGTSLDAVEPDPIAESIINVSVNGAIKGSATCDELKLEFWGRDGVLYDTLTLNK